MKIKKWDTLESQYLFRRPWLTVRRDKVRLPDGRINPEHYVLEYPDWVNILAITEKGEFVMIEQYRHGLDDVYIELAAGVVEKDEEPLDAARRELLEETGYSGGDWELLMVISQNPSISNNLTHCFLARNVVPTANQSLDSCEDIAVRLLSEDEVKSILLADEMKQALMAAPLWKYFYLKEKLKCGGNYRNLK